MNICKQAKKIYLLPETAVLFTTIPLRNMLIFRLLPMRLEWEHSVAQNLVKPMIKYMGTQGTSGLHIYDYNVASTGITETAASF